MAQLRSLDYKAPRQAKTVNDKFVNVAKPGVMTGLYAQPGTTSGKVKITAGVALNAQGVRVEETAAQDDLLTITANASGNPRLDLIVMNYVWQATEPAPVATFAIRQGTAAADPLPPSPSANDIVLAVARIEDGTSNYAWIAQTGRVYDATREILVGDGETTHGEYNGQEGLRAAVATLWDIGGTVRVSGFKFQEMPRPVGITSGIHIRGLGGAIIKSSPTGAFWCQGIIRTAAATFTESGGYVRLTDAGADFTTIGLRSFVQVAAGPNAGTWPIRQRISATVLELDLPDTVGDPDATPRDYEVDLYDCGLADITVDCSPNGGSSRDVEVQRVSYGRFERIILVGSDGTGDFGFRFRNCNSTRIVGCDSQSHETAFEFAGTENCVIAENRCEGAVSLEDGLRNEIRANDFPDDFAGGTTTLTGSVGNGDVGQGLLLEHATASGSASCTGPMVIRCKGKFTVPAGAIIQAAKGSLDAVTLTAAATAGTAQTGGGGGGGASAVAQGGSGGHAGGQGSGAGTGGSVDTALIAALKSYWLKEWSWLRDTVNQAGANGGSSAPAGNKGGGAGESDSSYRFGPLFIFADGEINVAGMILATGGDGDDGVDGTSGVDQADGGGGGGGSGGGFVVLMSRSRIHIEATGVVAANGGPGGDGGDAFADGNGGGGGGGGGGGVIYLVAPSVQIDGGATVGANGGAGGTGGTAPGAGDAGDNGGAGSNGIYKVIEIDPQSLWMT